jgi:hypothetical protein
LPSDPFGHSPDENESEGNYGHAHARADNAPSQFVPDCRRLAQMRNAGTLEVGVLSLPRRSRHPFSIGSVLLWRATLRRGRIERTDVTERVPPNGKLGHYFFIRIV